MKCKARYLSYRLKFKKPAGTSRGILHHKDTYFLILENGIQTGIGECALFKGLSIDDRPDYEAKLQWLCAHIHLEDDEIRKELSAYPSLLFGWETAVRSFNSQDVFKPFPSGFTDDQQPISINGLVWMGSEREMLTQIEDKLQSGFNCIKLKIGAIDFDAEWRLLKTIRDHFGANEIEIRVDANGAFQPSEALLKLEKLARLDVHSIEQPIKPGQWEKLQQLCERSPLPIALDEELIGVFGRKAKNELLNAIRPQYIILKPSLIGGFGSSEEWIQLAEALQTGWWVTSALESNIGLNAIAQWTYTLKSPRPQGLGTGGLFTNNIASPLTVDKGKLFWDSAKKWDTQLFG